MQDSEYNFLLNDRVQKIRSMDSEYNLLLNSYLSFSGGKDSTVLSALLDIALPNNRIPRVYINTGIEYKEIVSYVKHLAETDDRFVIIKPTQNIKTMLEENGYPFKSKEHSAKLHQYQVNGMDSKTVIRYLRNDRFSCPSKLKYQFTDEFHIKVSDNCCKKMKKEPAMKWAKENGKSITLTGMRNGEGGQRANKGCAVFLDDKCEVLSKFHPLMPIDESWVNEFVKRENIILCKLYYPPFNMERTGCKGCPFNIHLQKDLDMMEVYLPAERKQCELIWKPIYDEYRRINYRLKNNKQLNLFT